MSQQKIQMEWEKACESKFKNMIDRMPLFHREIAREVVERKACENARNRGSGKVYEEDVIRAFLSEVPKAFYSLMIRLFEEVGFEYRQYEE